MMGTAKLLLPEKNEAIFLVYYHPPVKYRAYNKKLGGYQSQTLGRFTRNCCKILNGLYHSPEVC